ncbi:citrate synthase [Streptomyces sp. ISL-87]|uniref:citrate synthase n=2 Tax=Streptomyces TaxID=1883 RepID=UPI001BED2EFA|nr:MULTISPECIES: citrate synthase [unclassified Streptomyces]MBT2407066.1 citrate synthase [Streptomyces sp. ISL-21]MBT2455866.1 citrate synthase [Streptomyces sp. ISL-86]MBT2609693.1 citrate synthase [Streptomyces sp. ISL-87]
MNDHADHADQTDHAEEADQSGRTDGAAEQRGSGRRLSTRQAAELLGVKPATVYAYVSRGQLTSRRDPVGRGSSFDAAEVEALARRSRREAAAAPSGELSVRTALTLIESDRYYFRGVDAVELASRYAYEEVAEWLWTGKLVRGARFTAPPEPLAAARRAVAALPEHSGPVDRLRVAVAAAAVADPLRFDLSEGAVLASARCLIPTLVGALPEVGPAQWGGDGRLARRLWPRLTAREPDPDALALLDLSLSLLTDHDLAASTLAVRVAASARAHPYAAVSAGLGVLEGPLHGAAGRLAHRMLVEVLERGGAAPVVAEYLRAGRRVPGLGHRLYQGEDPRAAALFGRLEGLPQAGPALAAAREVAAVMARQGGGLHANVDLALAVLTLSCGMSAEAGETVFAVARTAGWIAHALEEYQERPLRMRPSGHYTGPRPPQPMP